MFNESNTISQESPAWRGFVVVSFVVSLSATSFGLLLLPVDFWMKGYMAMGLYFTIASTVILVKTIRDAHETSKLVNRISEARTEEMLKKYDAVTP